MTQNENMENENQSPAEAEAELNVSIDEASVAEAVEMETVVKDVVEDVASEVNKESDFEEETISVEVENKEDLPSAESALQDELATDGKHTNKIFAFAGLLALIVMCLGLWLAYSGIFAPKYAPTYDNSKNTAYFVQNDAVMGYKDNGDTYKVFENTTIGEAGFTFLDFANGASMRSPNGEAFFFYENFNAETFSGDLYVRYKDKEKIKIDTDVSIGSICSSDGKIILYPKLNVIEEEKRSEVDFYVYRKGKAPQLLQKNVSQTIMPVFSQSAAYIAYGVDNAKTQKTELYVVKSSDRKLKPKKVSNSVARIYAVKDNGYVFFNDVLTTEDGTQKNALYYASAKKGSVKVSEDAIAAETFIGQFTNNFAYYTSTPDGKTEFNLGKIGKKPKSVFSAESQLNFKLDAENENFLFVLPNENNTELLDFHVVRGNKHEIIATESDAIALNYSKTSRDYKKMIYFKNFNSDNYYGELYITEKKFGLTKTKKIADKVGYAMASEDLDYILYFTDIDISTGIGTMHIYNGRKSTKVSEKVMYAEFDKKDKKLFYLTDASANFETATLNVINTNRPTKNLVIDKEISLANTELLFSSRNDGSVYYIKNYDAQTGKGDLCFAKNNKTGNVIAKGVSQLIFEN